MFNIKINYNHKIFGLITGLIELIFELLNLWHLEKNASGNRLDV
jgi:hypothetical protein